jgi:hypothetical protein
MYKDREMEREKKERARGQERPRRERSHDRDSRRKGRWRLVSSCERKRGRARKAEGGRMATHYLN